MKLLSKAILTLICLTTFENIYARSPGQGALDKGVEYYRQGKYQKSFDYFSQATARDPGLLSAWENLGWSQLKLNRPAEAIKSWNLVLKLDPSRFTLMNEISKIYVDGAALDRAEELCLKSLRIKDNQPEIHLRLANLYYERHQPISAKKHYEIAAIDKNTRNNALRGLVELYLEANDPDAALSLLGEHALLSAKKTKLSNRVTGWLIAKGNERFQDADYGGALNHFLYALATDGNNETAWVNTGWAFRRLNQVEAAIDTWVMALNHGHGSESLPIAIADAFRDIGAAEEARIWYTKSYRPENDKFRQLIAYNVAKLFLAGKDPKNAEYWENLIFDKVGEDQSWYGKISSLYIQNTLVTDGIIYFKRIVEREKSSDARKAYARLLAAQGGSLYQENNIEDAIKFYQTALSMDDSNFEALRDLGWAYWKNDDWNRCESVWAVFLQKYPKSSIPRNLLVKLYLNTKQYIKAIKLAEESLQIDSTQPDMHIARARALLSSKQYAAAKSAAKKLASSYPDDIRAQVVVAETLSVMRLFPSAQAQWERVLTIAAEDHPQRGYFQFKLIQSIYENGDYERARSMAESLAASPTPSKSILKLLAEDSYSDSNFSDVISWYQRYVDVYEEDPFGYLSLASAYYDSEEYDSAVNVLSNANIRFPHHVRIRLRLASSLSALGRTTEAINVYKEILAENANNEAAQQGLVDVLIKAGKFEAARLNLREQSDQSISDIARRVQRANIYLAMRDTGSVESQLKQLESPSPDTFYIPILLYHGLTIQQKSKSMNVLTFEEQMNALVSAGYHTVTLSQVHRALTRKERLPTKPIMITFDDARRDSLRYADPVLEKLGLSATMFVPTDFVIDDHPFFADWKFLNKYAANGRWDLQSHGHRAHEQLPVNERGELAGFLVTRAWLEDEARLERNDEYIRRLNSDYQSSKAELIIHTGDQPVGFAFPFSEAGQDGQGNVDEAWEINKAILFSHFDYGFIQEQNPYNALTYGKLEKQMLHRFNVPSDWDGKRLTGYLYSNHPIVKSQIMKGKAYLWEGRNSDAIQIFSKLTTTDTKLYPEPAYYLALANFEQKNYRTAYRQLVNSSLYSYDYKVYRSRKEELENDLLWTIRPILSTDLRLSADSNRKAFGKARSYFTVPLEAPVDLWLGSATTRYHEQGLQDVLGNSLEIGVSGNLYQFSLTSSIEYKQLTNLPNYSNYQANLSYEYDGSSIRLLVSRMDLETASALYSKLKVDQIIGASRISLSRSLYAEINGQFKSISDGNKRYDARFGGYFRVFGDAFWIMGVDSSYSDTSFQSKSYYTPEKVASAKFRNIFKLTMTRAHHVVADIGIGAARDFSHATKPIGHLAITLNNKWNSRFRTSLGIEGTQSEEYKGLTAISSLGFRF